MLRPIITGASATNGTPTSRTSYATCTITADTFANTVNLDSFTLAVPDGRAWQVVLDKLGTYVAVGRQIVANLVGDVTAANVLDSIATAINATLAPTALPDQGVTMNNVTGVVTRNYPGAFTEVNSESAAGAFAITNWSGGALPGIDIGMAKGSLGPPGLFNLHVYSTAGSGVMSCTIKLWGWSAGSERWAELGIGGGAVKGIINGGAAIDENPDIADQLNHREPLFLMHMVDRVDAQITAIANATINIDLEAVSV